ncbi:MAG: hypothetical protein ACYTGH_15380 [Planctomycetota bacterium]|jgi:hypothetical protein
MKKRLSVVMALWVGAFLLLSVGVNAGEEKKQVTIEGPVAVKVSKKKVSGSMEYEGKIVLVKRDAKGKALLAAAREAEGKVFSVVGSLVTPPEKKGGKKVSRLYIAVKGFEQKKDEDDGGEE